MDREKSAAALVRLEEIRVERQSPRGERSEIVRGVSFSAAAAEITVIIGPSGGGKSTLIRLINRLSDPTSGRIFLSGTDIVDIDPLQLRRRVGAVPQKPFMFQGTVLSNLQRPFLYRQAPLPDADSPDVAYAMNLARVPSALLQREARTLSVGEQQRVSLARALVTRPEVLLLDEPTSALDRPTGDQLAANLQEISHEQRIAIILVTHDLRLAEKVADYLLFLEGGRLIEEGKTAALLNHPQSPELRTFLAEPA
ncbi:ATP-binding cassette domain-containing protein [Geomonas sp. RF6]|uniref:ABC transporter ATP-binding protein n=1 Tax=Geomonas sp. RF6 TaxID=2897342 RepID=UPI001E518498|nr:ATP-binding cassette domain-containing protein [Geomonas sp. RF6]UFS70515.1 ATP-binding cassette domain-containing protein [Geomonas sp. RF6]